MASKNNKINVKNTKNKELEPVQEKTQKNEMIMKLLIFLGVAIFFFIIVYLMYHFFVENSDIKINMSTDKQMEYIKVNGEEKLILTQKYVSDLSYTMRYDIAEFKVFKYKHQDIYKNLNNENIVIAVEKSTLPDSCTTITSKNEYNNCTVEIDDYTENHFLSKNDEVYKITIKSPGNIKSDKEMQARLNHMINSFGITG